MTDGAARPGVRDLLCELAPQVLGAVTRRFGDFAAAEDAVQEALLAAHVAWPADGLPANPGGWLYSVACRRMADHLESEAARRRREEVAGSRRTSSEGASAREETDVTAHDDTLAILVMCCHPALTAPSAIALTLRAVGGLTTSEIASAFLVPTTTMAQRISRAKQTIASSGVTFALPEEVELVGRLDAVMHVLYLMFNEGYAASSGERLVRVDLSDEAIRLVRALHRLLPESAEVAGLLALLLLTDARRLARTGPNGELIPLHEQDRALWDRTAIAEGTALITATLSRGAVGSYQLQAAVAALHDEAPSVDATDWPQILALYTLLRRMTDNPLVALNRAVAAAMVHGPTKAMPLLDALEADSRLAGHYRLDAVRAHLLEMSGDLVAAVDRYRKAAAKTASVAERHYLMTKAARLERLPGGSS
jgi:RNA polymerase sigma factor (sigma-70 family)